MTTTSDRAVTGLRHFLTDGGFGAFTTNFQDLGGVCQLLVVIDADTSPHRFRSERWNQTYHRLRLGG